jgi:hypothetical protein
LIGKRLDGENVKRKNDMYYGSPSSTLGGGADKGKATLGATGIGNVAFPLSAPPPSVLDGEP